MNLKKKLFGLGTTVVAAATVLSMGIGAASAVTVIQEIDGAQLRNFGTVIRITVDVACTPGDQLFVEGQVTQKQKKPGQPAVIVTGSGSSNAQFCQNGDNDVTVDVFANGSTPFQATFRKNGNINPTNCDVTVDNNTANEYASTGPEACTATWQAPVT